MLNVRLEEEQEKKLKKYIQDNNVSKSSVVKEALAQYFAKNDMQQSPYALGEDLFGRFGSKESDHSTTYKSRLKNKLNAKHPH